MLEYEPPSHVALSWHINGEFKHDPAHASRVDVWFTQESAEVTRVDLVHSELDRHGKTWRQLRDGVSSEGGWQSLLDAYGAAAVG